MVRSAVLAAAFVAAGTLAVSGQAKPAGLFEGTGDVGAPKLAGSTAHNAITQEYTLSAAGTNMWAQRDEFQFAWRKMTGDFIIQARIAFIDKGVDPDRKAGLIVRSTLDFDGPYADAIIHGDGLTSLQYRRTKGAVTTRQSAIIPAGTNIRNNNDRVLSWDGLTIAISDQSLQGVGSTIYTVPVTGGSPTRITTLAPSYMHGWSPDQKWLVYTGGRSPGQGQPQNLDI